MGGCIQHISGPSFAGVKMVYNFGEYLDPSKHSYYYLKMSESSSEPCLGPSIGFILTASIAIYSLQLKL